MPDTGHLRGTFCVGVNKETRQNLPHHSAAVRSGPDRYERQGDTQCRAELKSLRRSAGLAFSAVNGLHLRATRPPEHIKLWVRIRHRSVARRPPRFAFQFAFHPVCAQRLIGGLLPPWQRFRIIVIAAPGRWRPARIVEQCRTLNIFHK